MFLALVFCKKRLRMSQIIFDPKDHCDCQDKEKAAPVLQHQDGSKVESELSDPHSASIV